MKYVSWIFAGLFVGLLLVFYLGHLDPLHIGYGTHTVDLR